ncbi:hypothetical protein HDU93_004209, partial [Gonapodya sp. JEL0774]
MVYGYSHRAGNAAALAVGYFLYDTILTFTELHHSGPTFLLHAVMSLVIFSAGLKPFLLPWVPYVLVWEAS